MRPSKLFSLSALSASLYLAGCKSGSNDAASRLQATAQARNASIQQTVIQTQQDYHAMTDSQLLEKLVEQSKRQKEPFNSLAYRELRNRKDLSADPVLVMVRQLKDGDALLPLLLLRRMHMDAYLAVPAEERAAVL